MSCLWYCGQTHLLCGLSQFGFQRSSSHICWGASPFCQSSYLSRQSKREAQIFNIQENLQCSFLVWKWPPSKLATGNFKSRYVCTSKNYPQKHLDIMTFSKKSTFGRNKELNVLPLFPHCTEREKMIKLSFSRNCAQFSQRFSDIAVSLTFATFLQLHFSKDLPAPAQRKC